MLRRHVVRGTGIYLITAIGLLYAILALTRQYGTPKSPEDTNADTRLHTGPERPLKDSETDDICAAYPDDGRVAISVKTGATEVFQKLPAMLNTSLTCVQDVMVFSDLEQKLVDVQIHDTLSRFSRAAIEGNPDWEIYWRQRELKSKGREDEIESLAKVLAPERDWQTAGKVASWGLDKYKFVHMLEMAYELQPGRDWYVFVEADTYLFWPNLKRWLSGMNPDTKLYIGNAVQKGNRPPKYFAHGGAGFVLSGAAMKVLAVDRKGAASRIDEHAHKWWAGDMMLADVLNKELSIEVTDAAPLFNHVDPEMLQTTMQALSRPAVTVHRVAPNEFNKLHRHERSRQSFELLLGDVYEILPVARELREGFVAVTNTAQ